MHSPVNEGSAIGSAHVAHPNRLAHELEKLAPHVGLSAVMKVEHQLHLQVLKDDGVKGMLGRFAVGHSKAQVVHWFLEVL